MKYAILFFVLILTGCNVKPLETIRTNNSSIDVETLFTKDGITVYRFEDGGRKIYFTSHGSIANPITENCGKGCTRTAYPQAMEN